jgi:GDP/UDP-N,N'-diacetylbacillosamine 2-epimerase (hydrolysing)
VKIAILTSSRADFGIYIPLIIALKKEKSISFNIIAFGTHVSLKYGNTITEIQKYTSNIIAIKTPLQNKSPQDIAVNIGKTTIIFSKFWKQNKYDYILALGDRYEMFAAVTAASPFNVSIAHIHAGETTLGAIDNMYRHSISLMSKILLVTTDIYKKVAQQINSNAKIFNVGALSIDNLKQTNLLSIKDFKTKFNIDLNKPTILSTFHPETVDLLGNKAHTKEFLKALTALSEAYQIIITLPNADTMGDYIRKEILDSSSKNKNIITVESFGMLGYLSCMKHCKLLIGNTSSGFVEAAFFPKWVINIGNRQNGRILTANIISTEINAVKILKSVEKIKNKELSQNCNVYGDGETASRIINILKNLQSEF